MTFRDKYGNEFTMLEVLKWWTKIAIDLDNGYAWIGPFLFTEGQSAFYPLPE